MTVGSVIELYTTLIGWNFYVNFWDMFTETGIAYIPFAVMVIKNFSEGYRGRPGDGAEQSVRAMEQDIVVMMTVIVLAAQPIYTLNPKDVEYTPPCTPSGAKGTTTYKAGDGKTTWDETLGKAAGGAVKVPIWWVGVMSLSAGANHAMLKSFDCMEDLRSVKDSAASANITDRAVRAQYNHFFSQCWGPAEAANKKDPGVIPGKTFDLAKKYGGVDDDGNVDPNWGTEDLRYIGSRLYLDVPGFYDTLEPPDIPAGYTTRPTCKEWWEGGGTGTGLKAALLAQTGASHYVAKAKATFSGASASVKDDHVIKAIQHNGPPTFIGTGFGSMGFDFSASDARGVAGAAALTAMAAPSAAVGAGLTALSIGTEIAGRAADFYITIYAIRQAAPMVQAFILMAIYAFLPVVLVFSGFRMMPVLTVTLAIFTVKFWSVLWFMVAWLDANLTIAIYGSTKNFIYSFNWIEGLILDIVTVSLYVGLPLLFTAVMSWGGTNVGRGVSDYMGSGVRGASGGARGAGGKLAKGGVKAVKGK